MKTNLFVSVYQKVLAWSRSSYAKYLLGFVSFIEAIIFPIPPDIMLVTMTLANKQRYIEYAMIATVFSVLGGILSYFLGLFFIDSIYLYITERGYEDFYLILHTWFNKWGFWIVFLSGFLPIPYKLFAVGAGAIRMNLEAFILASIFRRALRFFIVSFTVYRFEEKLSKTILLYANKISWAFLIVSLTILILYQYL